LATQPLAQAVDLAFTEGLLIHDPMTDRDQTGFLKDKGSWLARMARFSIAPTLELVAGQRLTHGRGDMRAMPHSPNDLLTY